MRYCGLSTLHCFVHFSDGAINEYGNPTTSTSLEMENSVFEQATTRVRQGYYMIFGSSH